LFPGFRWFAGFLLSLVSKRLYGRTASSSVSPPHNWWRWAPFLGMALPGRLSPCRPHRAPDRGLRWFNQHADGVGRRAARPQVTGDNLPYIDQGWSTARSTHQHRQAARGAAVQSAPTSTALLFGAAAVGATSSPHQSRKATGT
jgi:hypothetical protein